MIRIFVLSFPEIFCFNARKWYGWLLFLCNICMLSLARILSAGTQLDPPCPWAQRQGICSLYFISQLGSTWNLFYRLSDLATMCLFLLVDFETHEAELCGICLGTLISDPVSPMARFNECSWNCEWHCLKQSLIRSPAWSRWRQFWRWMVVMVIQQCECT